MQPLMTALISSLATSQHSPSLLLVPTSLSCFQSLEGTTFSPALWLFYRLLHVLEHSLLPLSSFYSSVRTQPLLVPQDQIWSSVLGNPPNPQIWIGDLF